MKIPKQVTVGDSVYVIQEPDRVASCHGKIHYDRRVIKIGKGNTYGAYTDDERSNTFWHELTHAILHDMGSGLAYDEEFVADFSDRLHKAIKTAKFE